MTDIRNHLCSHPGCGVWGSYGRRVPPRGPLISYTWYCRDHLPDDFLDPLRKAAAESGTPESGGAEKPRPRLAHVGRQKVLF